VQQSQKLAVKSQCQPYGRRARAMPTPSGGGPLPLAFNVTPALSTGSFPQAKSPSSKQKQKRAQIHCSKG